jgi:hypothetical protein
MKKTLIVAALFAAAVALPTMPTYAGDMAEAPTVEAKCFVAPLLPDCAAQWNEYWKAKGLHVTTPYAWWTCAKAEDGAGHLLDCETN